MKGINKTILVGNLGKDPELKYTGSGSPVCMLSVATNEKWKDKDGNAKEHTEWHRVVIFNKLAEIAAQYLKKGAGVYIEGKLQTRAYDDKDGQKRWTTEIVGRDLVMLGGNGESDTRQPRAADDPGQMGEPTGYENAVAATQITDDDVPF